MLVLYIDACDATNGLTLAARDTEFLDICLASVVRTDASHIFHCNNIIYFCIFVSGFSKRN